MYAIVRTGGKQYRVEEGRSFDVELLPAKEGASVELDNVLLIADNGNVTVGTPIIEGARVIADVESHGRQKKIVVFKFKAKVRTRKKTGHRQHFTRLAVTEILRPGQESKAVAAKKKAAPKRKTRKSTAKAAAADTPVAEADVTAAAPEERAPPTKKAAPKRTRKPAAAKASAAPEAGKKASPKRRTRKPAAPKAKAAADAGAESDDKATAEKKPARKRPSRRATKKAGEDKE